MAKKNIDLAVSFMMIATTRTGLWNSRNDSTAIASKRHVPPMATCWTSIGSWDETLKLSNILILMALDFTKISVRI